MASSRLSSATPEWTDVAFQVVAFEAINNVKIHLMISAEDNRGKGDMRVTAAAHRRAPEGVVAELLGSVNVTCSATNFRSLEAVVIHALYTLDGKLAEKEFARTKNQSA